MKECNLSWVFLISFFFLIFDPSSSHLLNLTAEYHHGHTAISDFRVINRRELGDCPDVNPYLEVNISSNSALSNEEYVTVTVSGVLLPAESDWIGMISPSHSDVSNCPQNAWLYFQTGDTSKLPLLCHYPVKGQYMTTDPAYLKCEKQECKKYVKGVCVVTTCSGSLTFHVINIRTDIEFVYFAGGFQTPCILKRSSPVSFANPQMPLYGHLSSVDSTGKSMKLTWVSGDNKPQQVQYAGGKSGTSMVTTFTQDNMCGPPFQSSYRDLLSVSFPLGVEAKWGQTFEYEAHRCMLQQCPKHSNAGSKIVPSPAMDFGWHDPGYIHSAVMTDLKPSSTYSYRYGSGSVGWSEQINFKTPPAGGSDELRFLAFGDMGKAPRDPSAEHYIQPGSLLAMKAMAAEVASGNVDSIFHIGDISYATGFLVEWDYFLHLINPVASQVSYMTAIGNHERDYLGSGSVYITPDSGGECGIAYETYFPMPTQGKDKPWYSIEQGSVHFTVISTEHDWNEGSEQYKWIQKDLGSVDRAQTPWVIFAGHRPMYSSMKGGLLPVDPDFIKEVEPLLLNNKVDLVLFGHVHNYERTCAVYQSECKAMPTKDKDGFDTYDNSNYSAPIHAVIGMAGFTLDEFSDNVDNWSLVRVTEFGYVRFHATRQEISVEFVKSDARQVKDRFRITKLG